MVAMADPVDLKFLDRFLMSDNAPENGMGLSDLDGFLTGILVGPELIMPSGWLPHVWGGEAPVFETQEQAQLVMSVIMAAITRSLARSRVSRVTSTRSFGSTLT